MSRYIQDGEFRRWEAFATTGDFGRANPARISFRCRSQPELRARAVFIEGDKSDAEKAVVEMSEEELESLFEQAEEVG
jgi:hypothetical protein